VKPGDLVKIDRASISVPRGTIGLIIKDASAGTGLEDVWSVQICGVDRWPVGIYRRFLGEDLEIV